MLVTVRLNPILETLGMRKEYKLDRTTTHYRTPRTYIFTLIHTYCQCRVANLPTHIKGCHFPLLVCICNTEFHPFPYCGFLGLFSWPDSHTAAFVIKFALLHFTIILTHSSSFNVMGSS